MDAITFNDAVETDTAGDTLTAEEAEEDAVVDGDGLSGDITPVAEGNDGTEAAEPREIDYEKLNSLNIGKINFKNSGTSSSKVNKSASVKKESASTVVYQTSSTTSSSVNLVDSSRSLSHDNLTVQEKLKYGYTTPDYLLSEAVSGMTVAQRNQSIINSLYSNRNNVNNQQNFGYNTSNGSIKIFP